MKDLLDVNVVRDVLLERQEWLAEVERQEWLAEARAIWEAAEARRLECCFAASSVTDIFYNSRKLAGQDRAREVVDLCLDILTIMPVDRAALLHSSERPERDFEDAVQITAALSAGSDAIMTRDEAGFVQSPVAVWTPAELVRRMTANRSSA